MDNVLIRKTDGTTVEMTYDSLCETLGFIPEVNFIRVTPNGYIGYTCGKDREIIDLYNACRNAGFCMTQSLRGNEKPIYYWGED